LTAAIANNRLTMTVCFSEEDFDFLVAFAIYVRDKLSLYDDVFVRQILCGIAATESHVTPPANRCRLSMLDRGLETGIIFKRTIAEFLGVPLKVELRLLRSASEGLTKYGY